jgi:hypothetical protein
MRAGVAQSVLCLNTVWTTGVRSPEWAKDFPLLFAFKPALRPIHPNIQWVPGVKRDQDVTLITHPIHCRGQE